MKKWSAAPFPAKIDKKTTPGPSFFEKVAFFIDFGLPGGTPKWVKWGDDPWSKRSWEPSGSHLGGILGAWSLFSRFWRHFGSVLGPSGLDLGSLLDVFLITEGLAKQHHRKTTRQQDNRTATQQPNNPTTKRFSPKPNNPPTKWFGLAECAERLN